MCFVSRPMKIVTFLRKNGETPKRVVDFHLERHTFRNKIMEIVEDFACESKFIHLSSFFSSFSSFSSFFHFFIFFIFSFFSFFHFLSFSLSFFFFFSFSFSFIFSHFLSCSFIFFFLCWVIKIFFFWASMSLRFLLTILK